MNLMIHLPLSCLYPIKCLCPLTTETSETMRLGNPSLEIAAMGKAQNK